MNIRIPKEGSRWTDYDEGLIFRVLNTTEIDGNIWVHYISESNLPREYSCYLESFLSRFRQLPS